MTETRKFDEQTDRAHPAACGRGSGLGAAGSNSFIDRADPYWGHVLDKARTAYGDPHMSFNTNDVGQDRRLVFGDGSAVPPTAHWRTETQDVTRPYLSSTTTGTVSPLAANGAPGQPITPAGFRRTDDGTYATRLVSGIKSRR